MMLNGRVYKLTNPNCTRCYVGSSKSKYLSIRMSHHREKHRKGLQNFYGLFDDAFALHYHHHCVPPSHWIFEAS